MLKTTLGNGRNIYVATYIFIYPYFFANTPTNNKGNKIFTLY
jgi:hypothetical protein